MEVMLTVFIFFIVAALALPMLKSNNVTKLRAAAAMLVADMEFAQAESIAHGDALRVVVINNATSYSIATAATPNTPITNPVGKLPYLTTYGSDRAASLSGVTIQSYSLGGDNILGFGLYGQLDQTSNATITLAAGSNNVTITFDATSGTATIGTIN